MGCNIHIFAEVMNKGEWQLNCDLVFPNPWYISPQDTKHNSSKGVIEIQEWEKDKYNADPPAIQDYEWFGLLADVPNELNPRRKITSISVPRGMPSDASAWWISYVKGWQDRLDLLSFLYLDDFLKFDWQYHKIDSEIMIPYSKYKKGQFHKSDIIEILKDNEILISEDQAQMLNNSEVADIELTTYKVDSEGILRIASTGLKAYNIVVQCGVSLSYRKYFDKHFQQVIIPLTELKNRYENVRLVFAFNFTQV